MGTIYVDFCNNFFNMSRRKKSYLANMGHCKVCNRVHQATNARLVVSNTDTVLLLCGGIFKRFFIQVLTRCFASS